MILRRPALFFLSLVITAILLGLALGVAAGSSHVITDQYINVEPDGYWTAVVAAGEHQQWSFDLAETRDHHILIDTEDPADASLSVSIDGEELGTVSEASLFTRSLEHGSHAVTVVNPGEVPIQYQFYMGNSNLNAKLDLVMVKDDGGVSVVPGGTIVYTLTISNNTNIAGFNTDLMLTETVPDNTTFNPGSSTPGWACAPNDDAGSTCKKSIGIVTVVGVQVVFAVDVDSPLPSGVTQIDNTASFVSTGDLNPDNNEASDSTPIRRAVGGTTSFLADGSGSIGKIVVLAGGVVGAFAILAASGWYARRRWLGNRS